MYRSLVAVIVLMAVSCSPTSRPPPTGPARIHFEQTTVELGEIPVRPEPYRAEFAFNNRGFDPLEISLLEKSCTCLDTEISQALVPPTENGVIIVKVAVDQAGERSARVTVHSNDQERPQVALDVNWRAVAPIEFDPLRLNFGVVRPGTTSEQTVDVLHRGFDDEHECRVLSVHSASRELSASYRGPTERTHGSVQVRLTSGTESGRFSATLRAVLDGCWTGHISLPVEWTVRDAIETSPRRLMLGFGEAGETLERMLIVTCDPGDVLRVANVTVRDGSWAAVKLEQSTDQLAKLSVTATLPDDPGSYSAALEITCTSPQRRILSVPVSAVVLAGDPPTPSEFDPEQEAASQ